MLLYSELSTGLKFNPGKKEFTKLYKNISYFLNDNLMSLPIVNLDVELERIYIDILVDDEILLRLKSRLLPFKINWEDKINV